MVLYLLQFILNVFAISFIIFISSNLHLINQNIIIIYVVFIVGLFIIHFINNIVVYLKDPKMYYDRPLMNIFKIQLRHFFNEKEKKLKRYFLQILVYKTNLFLLIIPLIIFIPLLIFKILSGKLTLYLLTFEICNFHSLIINMTFSSFYYKQIYKIYLADKEKFKNKINSILS